MNLQWSGKETARSGRSPLSSDMSSLTVRSPRRGTSAPRRAPGSPRRWPSLGDRGILRLLPEQAAEHGATIRPPEGGQPGRPRYTGRLMGGVADKLGRPGPDGGIRRPGFRSAWDTSRQGHRDPQRPPDRAIRPAVDAIAALEPGSRPSDDGLKARTSEFANGCPAPGELVPPAADALREGLLPARSRRPWRPSCRKPMRRSARPRAA